MSGMEILTVCIALLSLAIAAHAEWRVSKAEAFKDVQWEAHRLPDRHNQARFRIENTGRETVKFARVDPAKFERVRITMNLGGWYISPGDSFSVTFDGDDYGQRTDPIPIVWTSKNGKDRRSFAPVRSDGREAQHE